MESKKKDGVAKLSGITVRGNDGKERTKYIPDYVMKQLNWYLKAERRECTYSQAAQRIDQINAEQMKASLKPPFYFNRLVTYFKMRFLKQHHKGAQPNRMERLDSKFKPEKNKHPKTKLKFVLDLETITFSKMHFSKPQVKFEDEKVDNPNLFVHEKFFPFFSTVASCLITKDKSFSGYSSKMPVIDRFFRRNGLDDGGAKRRLRNLLDNLPHNVLDQYATSLKALWGESISYRLASRSAKLEYDASTFTVRVTFQVEGYLRQQVELGDPPDFSNTISLELNESLKFIKRVVIKKNLFNTQNTNQIESDIKSVDAFQQQPSLYKSNRIFIQGSEVACEEIWRKFSNHLARYADKTGARLPSDQVKKNLPRIMKNRNQAITLLLMRLQVSMNMYQKALADEQKKPGEEAYRVMINLAIQFREILRKQAPWYQGKSQFLTMLDNILPKRCLSVKGKPNTQLMELLRGRFDLFKQNDHCSYSAPFASLFTSLGEPVNEGPPSRKLKTFRPSRRDSSLFSDDRQVPHSKNSQAQTLRAKYATR